MPVAEGVEVHGVEIAAGAPPNFRGCLAFCGRAFCRREQAPREQQARFGGIVKLGIRAAPDEIGYGGIVLQRAPQSRVRRRLVFFPARRGVVALAPRRNL